MPAEPGLRSELELVVQDKDLATSYGSGDVPVLATPRVVALCEQATVAALRGHLQPGETTVGMTVQLEHLAPTPVGSRVVAEARVEDVTGRRVIFKVSARDERGLIAAGRVTRVLVERESFLEKIR